MTPIDIREVIPLPQGKLNEGLYPPRSNQPINIIQEFMPSSELISALGLFLPRINRKKLVLDETLVPKASAIRKAVIGDEST